MFYTHLIDYERNDPMKGYPHDQKTMDHIRSHNVRYDNSVKSTIYSKFTRWLIKPIRYVKSYYTFMQHTRLLEYLFSYLTFLLVIVFFYFLTIFLCAVDDSCAAIYMGGA